MGHIRSLLLLGLALVVCAPAPASPGSESTPGDALPSEVIACLRADGLLDLDDLRGHGYRGGVAFPGLRLAPGSWPLADEATAAPGKAAGDEFWMGDFPVRTPESVEDMCDWNGALVVASEREVYRWSGSGWQSLGIRANGTIHCVTAYGGDLVVGGDFTVAGGVAANRLARFDGLRWDPVGLGFDDRVAVLGTYGAQLIAAGDFRLAGSASALRIAAWDGSAWLPLAGGLGAGITAMTEYGNALVVSGSFHSVGSMIVNHIAAWDGSTWTALENGLNDEAWTLAVHRGTLVAAGPFTTAGITEVDGVAAWDGAAWTTFGDPQVSAQQSYHLCDNAGVLSLAVHNDSFVRVLLWDGAAWQQIVFDAGLRVLGLCSVAGQAAAAMSSGERTWIHLTNGQTSVILEGLGLDGDVLASTMWNDNLIVAGTFTHIGNVAATGIARWDGANWHALGGGLAYANAGHGIRALAVHDGDLIAGGNFHQIDGVAATHVARWNGSNWAPLGGAYSDGTPEAGVLCLASYGGDLYAGGDFQWLVPGYGRVNRSVRWHDGAWARLEVFPGWSGVIRSLCVYGGSLAIGGCPWATCAAVTLFDGVNYLSLAGAIWDEPHLMRVYDGRLYVASSGGELKSWDGAVWRNVLGRDATVSLAAMEVYNGRLVLGGRFDQVAGMAARNIVAWDGVGWARLGSGVGRDGVDEGVATMVTTPWGLAVGGDFWQAGGKLFRGLARWNEAVATDAPPVVPPATDRLAQNVPNPFNPSTTISFALRASGAVDLRVFDLRGALVRTLAEGLFDAGSHDCVWTGLSDDGRPVPSGTYVYRLRTTAGDITRKLVLVR